MQNYVFVLNVDRKPLAPCHPAVARKLLKTTKAVVFRRFPFTIILREAKLCQPNGENTPLRLKIDPGSRTTGMVLLSGNKVVWASELTHRGLKIKEALESRRTVRRSRRNRKTRYRQPRFLNRTRKAGWLPPSIESRVRNVETWVVRLCKAAPIGYISQELVNFDIQKLVNPEISGIEYQQGTLAGYELREYMLEKWNRKCAYCGKTDVPFEIEHIIPKSAGGSNRVSNLTLSCRKCNQLKDNRPVEEFLKSKPEILRKVKSQAKTPLRDAAAVNAARWALLNRLKSFGLPVECGSGGRTKFNRIRQKYPKEHWIDAACVGASGESVLLYPAQKPLQIKAVGHQCRQMCRPDKYGFPRTGSKQSRVVKGFQTGDIVKAVVSTGKKQGVHIGRVAVRASGSFDIGKVQGIGWKRCTILHHSDGYSYYSSIN